MHSILHEVLSNQLPIYISIIGEDNKRSSRLSNSLLKFVEKVKNLILLQEKLIYMHYLQLNLSGSKNLFYGGYFLFLLGRVEVV